jgi:hypothetical protein
MGWTACYATPLEFQAHLVKGYLEQYGVPCLVEGAGFGPAPLGQGEVRVLVRADWVDVAQGLLRSREQAEPPRRLRLVRRSNPS